MVLESGIIVSERVGRGFSQARAHFAIAGWLYDRNVSRRLTSGGIYVSIRLSYQWSSSEAVSDASAPYWYDGIKMRFF